MFQPEHFGLAAHSTQRLSDWYQKTLGASILWSDQQSPPAFLLRLGASLVIEIYPADLPLKECSNNKLGGWRHLALRVDSLEAARLHLEKSGVVITEPVKPAGGGGKVLFFQDPEGNLLHLVERATPPLFPLVHSP